ncbi:HNH endonuclease signature motif containing protein [Nocardioides taihuensis]|uniref:DUF222 domain-containing protein n=1 Tax=Nocardioides taihuensis TaxID=1835606 RepID=A0ABW0BJ08_9ACTN
MQDLSRDTTLDHGRDRGSGSTLATDSPVEVLGFLRDRRAAADAAEADILKAAAQWAAMHSEAALDPAEPVFGDKVASLAGPGAPGILEFSVMEFAAALGMSTGWGAAYLGAAIELRHRLPKVWARVMAGDLQAWRARRIAEATVWLSPAAAAHVDRHVAPVAHQIRPTALDRLVEEAATRHDPDQLARRTQAATDRRGVHLDTSRTSLAGTVPLHGELDLPDALTLDEALAHGAAGLATLGSTESLDARRGTSVARGRGASPPGDGLGADPSATYRGSEAEEGGWRRVGEGSTAREPHDGPRDPRAEPLGRVGTTHTPVTADTIRDWCGTADHLVIKPVIDLHQRIHVTAYEVPDRIKEHLTLRDHTCVFPWCTRPAETCDTDHVHPWDTGGRDLHGQPRTPVPTTPPRQDPRRLAPHHALPRHLPVALTPRPPPAPRPHRHPTPPRPRPHLTTPPHTPPHSGAVGMSGVRVRSRSWRRARVRTWPCRHCVVRG